MFFMHCLCMIWALGECCGHGQCVPSQYFEEKSNSRILYLIFWQFLRICIKLLTDGAYPHDCSRLFITIFLDSTFPHNGHCHWHHRNHHTPTHHNQLQHHWTPSHLFKNWKLLSSWLQLQKSSAAVTNVILLHLKKKTWRHVQKKVTEERIQINAISVTLPPLNLWNEHA